MRRDIEKSAGAPHLRGFRRCGPVAFSLIFLAVVISARGQSPPATPTLQERLGYSPTARLLIIHADDLGMAHSVNRATLEALEKGWVTSASVMVPCPWFPEVARWAKAHPQADLGIHLTLDSEWTSFRWRPISGAEQVPSLLDADGYLPLDPELLHGALPEIEREVRAQIERARALGLAITHLDSHMLALTSKPDYFRLYLQLSHDYKVPIRLAREGESKAEPFLKLSNDDLVLDRVISMDPGISKGDWATWYENALAALLPGVYELVVHLAYDDAEMQGATADHPDWGAAWRQSDFDMVRSPEFAKFLHDHNFTLVSWRDLSTRLQNSSKTK
jgi:chitin disaccharide deacetylase